MKASEARNKSELIKNESTKREYQKIMQSVDQAVSKGEFSTWIYDPIGEYTKQVLISDGYTLTDESNYRNEYLIKLNW